MYYPSSWNRPTEDVTYTTSTSIMGIDTTRWETSSDTARWETSSDAAWGTTTISPEYTLEVGDIKYKDEVTEEWYEMNEEPDPFVTKPKKAVRVRAKIKLDKKLGVDVGKVADMLF